jgi:hypothetical protein
MLNELLFSAFAPSDGERKATASQTTGSKNSYWERRRTPGHRPRNTLTQLFPNERIS